MEAVELGDAKAAYAVFFDHFHRATAAERHESTRNFYNATMANTNSNIMEWLAMVPRRGKLLELVGGRADDGDRVSILIGGLLPEFKQLVTILNSEDALTYAEASKQLTDYATTNDLMNLTKSGRAGTRDKLFALDDKKADDKKADQKQRRKVDQPCRLFKD